MARTLIDQKLGSRSARLGLKPRPKPYYRLLGPDLHFGYRRNAKGPGCWVVRLYEGSGRYKVQKLRGAPDDLLDANGETVLSFAQAQEQARPLPQEAPPGRSPSSRLARPTFNS